MEGISRRVLKGVRGEISLNEYQEKVTYNRTHGEFSKRIPLRFSGVIPVGIADEIHRRLFKGALEHKKKFLKQYLKDSISYGIPKKFLKRLERFCEGNFKVISGGIRDFFFRIIQVGKCLEIHG